MDVIRRPMTISLDRELFRVLESIAASSGRPDYEILEAALRQYLGLAPAEDARKTLSDLLNELPGDQNLSDDEALDLAYSELRAARRKRRDESCTE